MIFGRYLVRGLGREDGSSQRYLLSVGQFRHGLDVIHTSHVMTPRSRLYIHHKPNFAPELLRILGATKLYKPGTQVIAINHQ